MPHNPKDAGTGSNCCFFPAPPGGCRRRCALHSHELPASGELQLLITGLHVVGVTTKPTIFASAMAKGDPYDGHMRDLAELGGSTETAIFTVTTDDVRG
jgi:hypothetical protein